MKIIVTNKIPEIENNFDGDINPYAKEIQQSMVEWANEIGILDSNNTNKYKSQKIAYLASHSQPYDSSENVRLTSDYLLLFCMLDDYSENVKDPIQFKEYSNRIIDVLRGNVIYIEDQFLNGWKDWWQRVQVVTPIEFHYLLIKNIKDCFEAMAWEINNQIKNEIPTVEDYNEKRLYNGSSFIAFNLIEIGGGKLLPTKVRYYLLNELIISANNLVNWTNDILSLKKEIENNEIHNLVISMQKQNGNTLEEALRDVKNIVDSEINKFNELKTEVYELNQPFDSNIVKYIARLENVIRGHYEWSLKSKRFIYSNI